LVPITSAPAGRSAYPVSRVELAEPVGVAERAVLGTEQPLDDHGERGRRRHRAPRLETAVGHHRHPRGVEQGEQLEVVDEGVEHRLVGAAEAADEMGEHLAGHQRSQPGVGAVALGDLLARDLAEELRRRPGVLAGPVRPD
jgi:hypothetical protein